MEINTNYVIYTVYNIPFNYNEIGTDFQNLSPPGVFVQIAWNFTDLLSSTISKSLWSAFSFILNLSKTTRLRKKTKPKLGLFSTKMDVKFQFFRYKNWKKTFFKNRASPVVLKFCCNHVSRISSYFDLFPRRR